MPHLWKRRRLANYSELTTATIFPRVVVPIYGAALSFGPKRVNPGVLVALKLTTLDQLTSPDDKVDVFYRDLAVDDITGHLHVHDSRFSSKPRPVSGVTWLCDTRLCEGGDPDSPIWRGNLGKDDTGRFYLADRGNSAVFGLMPDSIHFTPKAFEHMHPGSAEHRDLTVRVSRMMMNACREETFARSTKEFLTQKREEVNEA
ncbi:hypothetical protein [Terriglobus sp. RCC_193]|uniref:hypothetical protein n=1 Tax=Terriglobus sp. RCC_193 TaxID=3239218 RepID=UPI003524021F